MKNLRTAVRRSVLVGAVATLAATTITGVAPAQPADSASAGALAATPLLRLGHAADHVTLEKFGQHVPLNLGVYAIAGDQPFEVRAHRFSWNEPIAASIITSGGDIALPTNSMKDFLRIRRFFSLTFTNRAGDAVFSDDVGFCPSGDDVRVDPDAANPAKPYPTFCPFNPYTKGAVFGIAPGHAVPAFQQFGRGVKLAAGHYTATVKINEPYAGLMGLSAADATSKVKVDVVENSNGCFAPGAAAAGCKTSVSDGQTSRRTVIPTQPARRPGADAIGPVGASPDLRSLPAWAISLRRNHVTFAATVWNAGPSPLVVDGFRRPTEDVMDAYQYYYDADGNEVGHELVGSMEWDAGHGHHHWHFRDFARYRLLDANKQAVVRSRKEAFCLANTDAVDYTVDNANWNPFNTDLHTSCGDFTAMAVREVLDTGSGDTYIQSAAGQSFNIANLPNGVYYIAVEANPNGVIRETRENNNNSYRKIILKGTPDHRRLIVPQKGLVKEQGFFFF